VKEEEKAGEDESSNDEPSIDASDDKDENEEGSSDNDEKGSDQQ
jgi:hypothetical protein